MPIGEIEQGMDVLCLLIRSSELEFDSPRLRRVRHRLHEHQRALPQMVQQQRHWQRRVLDREALKHWQSPSDPDQTRARGLDGAQLERLLSWLRPLQKALNLEADQGFCDIQGRQQRFHQFLQEELARTPDLPFPLGCSIVWSGCAMDMQTYPRLICLAVVGW